MSEPNSDDEVEYLSIPRHVTDPFGMAFVAALFDTGGALCSLTAEVDPDRQRSERAPVAQRAMFARDAA